MSRTGVVFAKDGMVNYCGAHRRNKVTPKRTVLKRVMASIDGFLGDLCCGMTFAKGESSRRVQQ